MLLQLVSRADYDKIYTKSVSYFFIYHDDNPLCKRLHIRDRNWN